MSDSTSTPIYTNFNTTVIEFIGTFMNHLTLDKMIFEKDVASKEKQEFYTNLLPGNEMKLFQEMRNNSSLFLIRNAIEEYFKQLNSRVAKPINLALSASEAKLLVWAEIENDDELTENALIMSEASVNSEFSQYGIYFLTTIVEKQDNLQIPPHFKSIKLSTSKA